MIILNYLENKNLIEHNINLWMQKILYFNNYKSLKNDGKKLIRKFKFSCLEKFILIFIMQIGTPYFLKI